MYENCIKFKYLFLCVLFTSSPPLSLLRLVRFRCQLLPYFPAVLAVLLLLLLLDFVVAAVVLLPLSNTLLPPSFSAYSQRLPALSLRATLFITNGGVGAWPGSPHRFDVLRATVQSILTARRRH